MRLKSFAFGLLIGAILSIAAVAQNATEATIPSAPTPLTDIYGAGAAYSTGATPGSIPVAVNAFEAHLIPAKDNTRTYSYTTLFIVPTKETTTNAAGVTSTTTSFAKDLGVGAAVKALDIGSHGIYATATGGPSWTGGDTSWQFNYGGTMPIRIRKSSYYLFPIVAGVTNGGSAGSTKLVVMLDVAWGK